jgi:hypothetical protein
MGNYAGVDWASEVASCTPTRPRATSQRRNAVYNGSVSASPTSRPITSRRLVSCTARVTTRRSRTTRAPSRTFSTFAPSRR